MTAAPVAREASSGEGSTGPDPFDAGLAVAGPAALRPFNRAGVLVAADVHVATRLAGLCGSDGPGDGPLLLAVALAVRAPRLGHVCTDLATVATTVAVDGDHPSDPSALPWPEPGSWTGLVGASPLVAVGDGARPDRPLRLVGSRLYLDRYWQEERRVAADLVARAALPAPAVDDGLLAAGLERVFPGDGSGDQRLAAELAVRRLLAVVAGGPGTGKTTTVARILALLDDQAAAAGARPPLVALAAPTGKAAARLAEAVHDEASRLDCDPRTSAWLQGLQASTLHRLLGWRPDSRSRFRHDAGHPLPHEVVVVDETSMVSLGLMARLVEAVRSGARLVLVGDPAQLASVEAGAVLGDIVGPVATAPERAAPGSTSGAAPAGPAGDFGAAIAVLRRVHRFGGSIATVAEAIRCGDPDATVEALAGGADEVVWIPVDVAEPGSAAALGPVRTSALEAGRRVVEAARAGRATESLEALAGFRVLCAHRRGDHGVATWMARIEGWMAAGIDAFGSGGRWYPGRPLLVTQNDYGLRLYNGDTGVVVAGEGGRVVAVFDRRGEPLRVSPTRLAAVDTVYAMTVHKSQGSQFDSVAVLLPDPSSPVLTRELLYTAATRARRRLIVAGTEAAVRAAVSRPVSRASGLRERLWGPLVPPAPLV